MTERPILFTPENVRKILDGTKSQMRRVCGFEAEKVYWHRGPMVPQGTTDYKGWVREAGAPLLLPVKCPFSQVGDRLWVRHIIWMPTRKTVWARGGNKYCWSPFTKEVIWADGVHTFSQVTGIDESNGSWRKVPSIHVPRWACRLVLEITDIWVQRLQDISEADAVAEGCQPGEIPYRGTPGTRPASARIVYSRLWDSLNAKSGYGWDTNPWVWAISFRNVP